MPHVDITMYPGRDRETKAALAQKVRELLSAELKVDDKVVSVSIRDVPREEWPEHIQKYKDENMFLHPPVK